MYCLVQLRPCFDSDERSMNIPSGYRFPAEFERHRATWLLWPTRPDNWRGDGYFAQNDTLALAALIAHFEPVRVGAPATYVPKLRGQLPPLVSVTELAFNDTWVRDTGPITLVSDHQPAIAVDWKFNSWGGLFSQAGDDDGVAEEIARYEQLSVVKAPIVLEGGAVTSDGKGTIVTTEECALAANRNPGLTRAEAEHVFRRFLNAQNVIWLPYGLSHDEAGGHVDNVCAFASDRVLLVASTNDKAHPSYERLRVAREVLERSHNTAGQPFFLMDVPVPEATFITTDEAAGFARPEGTIVRTAGSPLAASYINFYPTAKAVFVPTFNISADGPAVEIIAAAFPDRQTIPFASREFLLGGGALHCVTKEIPV